MSGLVSLCTVENCDLPALPGCKHCKNHDGLREFRVNEQLSLNIRDAQYAKRVASLSAPEALQSLSTEIGIVSQLLETAINRPDDHRAAMHGQILQLTDQLAKLKQAHLKMAVQHGQLLAKATVVDLGRRISEIMIEELRDVPDYEQIVDRIVGKVFDNLMHGSV